MTTTTHCSSTQLYGEVDGGSDGGYMMTDITGRSQPGPGYRPGHLYSIHARAWTFRLRSLQRSTLSRSYPRSTTARPKVSPTPALDQSPDDECACFERTERDFSIRDS